MIMRFGRPGKVIVVALGTLFGVFLCYVGLGMGLYYWKENVKHFESGALLSLEALCTMEGNYKSHNGAYSGDFEELGLLLGSFAHDNKLTWNQEYFYEFSNVSRDASGRVTDFCITARPFIYKRSSHRSFLLDQSCNIYMTTENRPASTRDRILTTRR